MVVHNRQDRMRDAHFRRPGFGARPFEVLARPGPDVEGGIDVRFAFVYG